MSSVPVSAAGRSDQEGARPVMYQPEQSLNPDAALSPDLNPYQPEPSPFHPYSHRPRCVAINLNGKRCKGRAVLDTAYCMVHQGKVENEQR